MSLHAVIYLTGFFLAFCNLVILLLVIPAAAAASHRLKPGWRAWVWPLALLGLLGQAGAAAFATLLNLDSSSLLWQIGKGAACFSLTMLLLNSVYRLLDDSGAHRLALAAWIGYWLFALATIGLNFGPGLLIYEALCAIGLTVFYAWLYLKERERAADALPIVYGVILLLLGAGLASFELTLDLSFAMVNSALFANFAWIMALWFLYRGAANSYTVKYAAQRRRERDEPLLNS